MFELSEEACFFDEPHVLYKYMLVIAGIARRLSMCTPTDKPIKNAIKTNHLLELICLYSSSHFKNRPKLLR